MALRRLERLAAALIVCALVASPALAQITTGTVAGTVKDAQGGVVPGATVVLISETQGTKSAPAVTNDTGDYVFPNVTPDTYTVEVTMQGFKTVDARSTCGQRRRPRGGSGADPRSRRRGRNGQRHGRGAARPVAERRALVRGHDRAGREPADQPRQLHQPDRVDARRRRRRRVGGRHAPRRRRPEQHHDGRHLGHGHRQQRPDAQHEHRVDRRSQGPDPGLPGRVRPVERPADHGRHQERHEPVPRLGLRHPDQLRLEREPLGRTSRTATPSRSRRAKTLGYSIGGPVGKPGGNNKLFFFYATSIVRRTAAINSGNPIRLRVPDRARARRRLLADASTTTARLHFHQASVGLRRARDGPDA